MNSLKYRINLVVQDSALFAGAVTQIRLRIANLPTMILDTTLTELNKCARPETAHQHIGQVLYGTSSGNGLTNLFPRNGKFLYQDDSFDSIPKAELSETNVELRRPLAAKMHLLLPQRESFICGSTAVIFFNVDETPERIAYDKSEAESTLHFLAREQRPQLIFCAGSAQTPLKEHEVDMVAYKVALHPLENYTVTCEHKTQW